jgi:hypothetical protein
MKTPILGASYATRSSFIADNRAINLYPEQVAEGGKETGYLTRCPGLRLLGSCAGVVRGLYVMGGTCYAVGGDRLYALNQVTLNPEQLSDVYIAGEDAVSIADNGAQLFIAGDESYILTGSQLEQITDEDFPGASQVEYLDGYFVILEPNSQKLYYSALLDGTSYDGLDFNSVEGSPDKCVGIARSHLQLWAFGEDSTEVLYTSTDGLTRMQGAFIETGCASKNTIAKLDNTLFWVGRDRRGQGIVYRAEGYNGRRISTHAIEHVLETADLSTISAFAYHQAGHSFYVLNLPDTTFVYDAATGAWHERGSWNNGVIERWRAGCMAHYKGKIIVGDYQNGNIYAVEHGYFMDGLLPQQWARQWRAVAPGVHNGQRVRHKSLTVFFETGESPLSGQGYNPSVHLTWSDDGGKTWAEPLARLMGETGKYNQRIVWHRLGQSRDRIYKVFGSDPIPLNIAGAELDASA